MTLAAYGLLELRPWEIGRCTPAELLAMLEAVQEREDARVELIAWHCANLMNASGNLKQPVSVASLLNRPTVAMRRKKAKQEQDDAS